MKTIENEIKRTISNAEFILLSQTVVKDKIVGILLEVYSDIRGMEHRSYKTFLEQMPLEQLLIFLKRATKVVAKNQTKEVVC